MIKQVHHQNHKSDFVSSSNSDPVRLSKFSICYQPEQSYVYNRYKYFIGDDQDFRQKRLTIKRYHILAITYETISFYLDYGQTFLDEGDVKTYALIWSMIIVLHPDSASLHNNFACYLISCWTKETHPKILTLLRRSARLDPSNPLIHGNFGETLIVSGKLEEAIDYHYKILVFFPDFGKCSSNLSLVLYYSGERDKAVSIGHRACLLAPNLGEPHRNYGMALLSKGCFLEGWREYEWRQRTSLMRQFYPHFSQPEWKGEDGKGRYILIYQEQGYGDNIQFCRYASILAQRGWRVLIYVTPPLKRLMESLLFVERVLSQGDVIPPFESHCAMMSLPNLFKTDLQSIPSYPTYLRPQEKEALKWKKRLDRLAPHSLRVGLVWSGNSSIQLPHAQAINQRRSIDFSYFKILFDIDTIVFFSLQKDQNIQMKDYPLIDDMSAMRDFADTAAFIQALDLVISVDTAILHLSAAIGKPVWLLNRFGSCWRWLENQEDSPWYPTMRIFRQERQGDWESVFRKVKEELIRFKRAVKSEDSGNNIG
jgi:tetratricopeptide (TPR) repeat protein